MLLVPKLALLGILIVVFPVWSLIAGRRMRDADDIGDPLVRIAGYTRTIVQLSLATAAAFTLYRPADLFGFPTQPLLRGTVSDAILAAIFVAAVIYVAWSSRLPAPKDKPRALEVMAWALPSNAAEQRLWLALSITAAITEEFLFRGFVLRVFTSAPFALPLALAAFVATVGFAINHLYQGIAGAFVTFVVGGVMMLLFAATGNLLVPIVLHALIDARIVVLVRRYS